MVTELTGQALLDALTTEAKAAGSKGDLDGLMAVAAKIKAAKSELVKVEAERIRKESEALAGVREKAAKAIHGMVVANKQVAKLLADTKSLGFTFKLDTADIGYLAVALLVPQAPAHKGGTGGHVGGGKTKSEYGISLGEIFDKFGTAEEKAKNK